LLEEIGKAKLSLEEKYDALLTELKTEWKEWDKSVDGGAANATEEGRRKILAKMLDVLNRRNYVRNLVRDMNEAME
jgi:molecular chaperone HscB